MDLAGHIVMFIIGLAGSFFSGLLGIGGAIINYPLLLYVPGLFGVETFSPRQVSSISMIQVFFSSLAGMLAFLRQSKKEKPLMHRGLIMNMGASILIGSLVGSLSSAYLPSASINIIYGVLAVVAAVLMMIPGRGTQEEVQLASVQYNPWFSAVSALLVGVVSGIVGAGGSFILIPIMLTMLRIPVRVTVASSLAIVFISAIGGVSGKIAGGHIPLWPTLFTVLGSILGAPVGTMVSRHLNVKSLRIALAVLIAATAVKIWWGIITAGI
ncbi:sulfite exporter TauE/SafE family protein [Paenibacillus favisporus]|uniref:sulfite exporter TauE/SafE family protein n=1 Tax=Paenibacillus favisporus TaxID=221028 RepID=UPI002DBA2B54|nr:sulfite exporter TauE/SafE family protein [Paenibacillus favisporus]MEC0173595.1 sulfite exporter TauE/SafE family protein [Paenibacillus favisporus]